MIYKGSIVKGSGGGSGNVDWGDIGGTLSDQTDLANALAEKQDVIDSTHKLSASLVDGLATVATTGAYSDLSGTPTIPTVNNATLTIMQNNISVGTFTANASSDATFNLTDTTYSAFTGATGSVAGSAGLVPAPTATDNDKYLKGDGTWSAVSGGGLPSQTGNSGKFLTTDGTDASWATVDSLPSQTGNSGKYLTTNGTTASWATVSGGGLQNTATGFASLTIDAYTPSSYNGTINIGNYAKVLGYCSVAIGSDGEDVGYTEANAFGVAIGTAAQAGIDSVALGGLATATGSHSIALGAAITSNDYEFVVGYSDRQDWQNTTYLLMDLSTGKIPNDRINGVSGSFTSQDGKTVTVTNGVITSIV